MTRSHPLSPCLRRKGLLQICLLPSLLLLGLVQSCGGGGGGDGDQLPVPTGEARWDEMDWDAEAWN